ncbi:uncharacterized protein Fot_35374 [Forsythia ovata]|uniref:Uncharacterized protein n=1 Tax=Forsythia ovata TaxID=205694 RepID=A0ABD1SM07_9LAMI
MDGSFPSSVQSIEENELDAASFPHLPSKPASISGSRTLGDTDTESECSSEKPKNKGWLFAENNSGKPGKAPWVNLFKDNRNLGQGLRLDSFQNSTDVVTLVDAELDIIENRWGFGRRLLCGSFPWKSSPLETL